MLLCQETQRENVQPSQTFELKDVSNRRDRKRDSSSAAPDITGVIRCHVVVENGIVASGSMAFMTTPSAMP